MAYFILLFCILLAARERAWVTTALLFVAAGMALIYLVMRGLAMGWPLLRFPRP